MGPDRVIFSYQCSGHGPFSTGAFGLWVRVKILGSDCNNRFHNTNHNHKQPFRPLLLLDVSILTRATHGLLS